MALLAQRIVSMSDQDIDAEIARSAAVHGPLRVPQFIDMPTPSIGGKCWVLERKGLFVLERGPGVLRTIACTHAGAGAIEAIDGVPTASGFFHAENDPAPWRGQFDVFGGPDGDARFRMAMQGWCSRNGRALYRANPIVMGSWMLDGGFMHGLTIRCTSGHESAAAIASIVWMPVPKPRGDVK